MDFLKSPEEIGYGVTLRNEHACVKYFKLDLEICSGEVQVVY